MKKGIEEGIAAVIEGASVVSGKMDESTAEGKRQYKMFDLKSKIQSHMTELGGRAYDVLDRKKSPVADSKIKAVFVKIKKLEEQLRRLEGGKEKKVVAPQKAGDENKISPEKKRTGVSKKGGNENRRKDFS
ncbi:MAG: hypothetical protein MZV70_24190 [Desulfobacterales bacterium]|nr:hypothetical protein [Desulfobacterales bacterium]